MTCGMDWQPIESLKRCPCCGSEDVKTSESEGHGGDADYEITCHGCGVTVGRWVPWGANKEDKAIAQNEAVAVWNTRTETQSQATIDELVMLLGRLCDAYELVCSDAGKNYHQSPSSVYAHCRHAIAKAGGQS